MGQFVNFKELRARLDFRAILKHYRVELTEKAGGQASGYCPLPTHKGKEGKARSPSFSAQLDKGIWQCFGCGCSGNIIEFATRMEGLNPEDGQQFRQVALMLDATWNGGQAQTPEPPTAKRAEASSTNTVDAPDTPGLPVTVNAPLEFELKELDSNHPYLLERGFTPETVAHFGVGFCQRGLMKGRVAIPLYDNTAALVGYAGRVVDDRAVNAENPRYKFPGVREAKGVRHEFHKSAFLYNGHAISKPVNDLVVVEGFTALWWLWQHGYHNTVGLMGSDCSDTQAALILERSKPKGRIWYFADGDTAGVKCAKDTLAMLATSRLVRLVIADGRQPTDFTEGELKKLLPF